MVIPTLKELFAKHHKNGWPDRDTVHSYCDVYEKIFEPYRHTAKNVLEIGLMSGESLRVWAEYFDGKVYGMDCSETPIDGLADLRPIISDGKHNVVIGDATKFSDVFNAFKNVKFEIIIEDAGHDLQQQIDIYKNLKSYLSDNHLYIIEDVQSIENANILSEQFGGEIIDRRSVKGRYDDLLIIIR